MNYCSHCAAPVERKVPAGDNLPRFVCDACGTIHYHNPKIVAGCIAEWEDRIVMCRRGIEPRHGLWTLPAGYMENGETTQQGAARETLEEACARVEVKTLYALISIPHISQVYMMFRGTLIDPEIGAGPESLETVLMQEQDIPWEELAFPVMHLVLERYFRQRKTGKFDIYTGAIEKGTVLPTPAGS